MMNFQLKIKVLHFDKLYYSMYDMLVIQWVVLHHHNAYSIMFHVLPDKQLVGTAFRMNTFDPNTRENNIVQ